MVKCTRTGGDIMVNTGIIKSLDKLGRIVIPKKLRKGFNIEQGTQIEIKLDGDKIILKKVNEL